VVFSSVHNYTRGAYPYHSKAAANLRGTCETEYSSHVKVTADRHAQMTVTHPHSLLPPLDDSFLLNYREADRGNDGDD
jgi:hypothetical protein